MFLKGMWKDGFLQIKTPMRFQGNTQFDAANPIGNTYWVWSNGSDSNDGKGSNAEHAFRTLAHAVKAADDWDIIRVRAAHRDWVSDADPGQYAYLERDIPINIDQMGLKIIGDTAPGGFMYGSPTIHAHNAASTYSHPDAYGVAGSIVDNLFNIRANSVEIANICIQMQIAACGIAIAPTHQVSRTYLHDIAFTGYGGAYGTYAVFMQGSPECSMVQIENCLFSGWVTKSVQWNCGSGSVFRNNIVLVEDNAIGIDITTSGKPWGSFILSNRFVASGTGSYGIKITSQYGTGMLLIDDNRSAGFNGAQDYPTYAAASFGANYRNGALVTA